MELVGYCTIKKGATTGRGDKLDTFIGKDVRVMEFASDGGVLVVNSEATALATFDKEDIFRKFECRESGGCITPPEMNIAEQIIYSLKCIGRKGGYPPVLREMVIQASLAK